MPLEPFILNSLIRLYSLARHAAWVSLNLGDVFLRSPGNNLRYVPAWLLSLYSGKTPLTAHVPWLPYPAISHLEKHLHRGNVAFEYGAGGSTLWLAERVWRVTTVEHTPPWHAFVEKELRGSGVDNCLLLLREPQPQSPTPSAVLQDGITYHSSVLEGSFEEHAKTIEQFPDGSLDVVIVDGRSRAACLVHAAPKVRAGGVSVLDNSDRERCQAAMRTLRSWPRKDICGIVPFSRRSGHTTFWIRPAGEP